jgi:hypothetical protein
VTTIFVAITAVMLLKTSTISDTIGANIPFREFLGQVEEVEIWVRRWIEHSLFVP